MEGFRFVHRLRVRWAEVDPQAVVFNAHYLGLADVAVTEYWRRLGWPYPCVPEIFGGDLYMRHVDIDYLAPVRFDDWVDIGLRCARLGNSSLALEAVMAVDGRRVNRIGLVYAYADAGAQRAQPLPDLLRNTVQAFEAGEAMFHLHLCDWAAARPQVAALRRRVFIEEQGVPEALEWDEDDARSVHAVLVHRDGRVVATGRLLPPDAKACSRIGRMAVERRLRHAGLGRQIIEALMQAARERGDASVNLHAQRQAQGFYERLGFSVRGGPFDEAGIAHVEMWRAL
jgi:YbgC/YbaW family acyl-CoA thioester hydrolase